MTSRGFTLLESLIYIGVLAVIVTAVSSYFLWTIKSSVKAKVVGETLENTQRVMDMIVYEIRQAESIYTPTSVFNSHPGQLSLETKQNIPLALDENITYLDFYVSNGRLCFKKESQNSVCLSSDRVEVQNFVLSQVVTGTVPSIQIDLSIKHKDTTGKPEYQALVNLRSVVSLRSY